MKKFQFHLTRLFFLTLIYTLFLSAIEANAQPQKQENQWERIETWNKNFQQADRMPPQQKSPSHTCVPSSGGLDDIAGQVTREFDNALLRDVIAEKVFGCAINYTKQYKISQTMLYSKEDADDPCLGSRDFKDISGLIKELFPRLSAVDDANLYSNNVDQRRRGTPVTDELYGEYDNDKQYTRDRILSLLDKSFTFQSGIPNDMAYLPKTAPPIDEVQCGYCQPSHLEGVEEQAEYDYRICFLFRKGIAYSLYARLGWVLPNLRDK